MSKIFVKMMNIPSVYINDEKVAFPFKKVEALFYYLLINEQATRDELVALLWPEAEEETGKKNLRNAIYHIKKIFNEDIIISDRKSVVALNPEIQIDTDIEHILKEKINSEDNEYIGEFLKGFYLKQSEEFEQWIDIKREYYKGLFISMLNKKLQHAINENNFSLEESIYKSLIAVDEFNEQAYRGLMKTYMDTGSFNKAIDLYNKLKKVLQEELGIQPEVKSIELFERATESRNASSNDDFNRNIEFFYGREKEIALLIYWLSVFSKENSTKLISIIGEAGVGKSKLKDKFIENIDKEKMYVIQTNCYQAEEKYVLKPWNSIFSRISELISQQNINIPSMWTSIVSQVFPNFSLENNVEEINFSENNESLKFQAVEEIILKILKIVSSRKKIILVIEDLQWIDEMSLSLINSIMLNEHCNNIMFLCTCRNGYGNKIDDIFSLLSRYNKIEKLSLERFTENEVEEFVKAIFPNRVITAELNEKIYKETEGIAFFLIEYINSIKDNKTMDLTSSKMVDILRGRFMGLTEEGKKILNLAALFFDYVSHDMLRELSGKEELYLLDILEELQSKYILREEMYGEKIVYKFTHQKLREFIYMQQSMARRKILHKKVALIMESSLKNSVGDIMTYSHLIYHFTNGGDKLSALKYCIKNLNTYLDFNHELFPVLEDLNYNKGLYLSSVQARKYLNEMEELLEDVKALDESYMEVTKLEIGYLHLVGRYLIREGNYKEGSVKIERMIGLALKIDDKDYALKGYKQMIYYYIQVNNIELMQNFIELALDISRITKKQNEIGILLRLKGLNKIMAGAYEEAEKLILESINNLQSSENYQDKFLLNIAAAYNYIGDIRRYKKDYQGALSYYESSIKLCEDKKILIGLPQFSTNAGMAAYELNNIQGAKYYFEKALGIYNKLDSLWGRSIAEAYMCLISISEGRKADGKEHLKAADYYLKKLKSPNEISIVSKLKVEIMKNNMD